MPCSCVWSWFRSLLAFVTATQVTAVCLSSQYVYVCMWFSCFMLISISFIHKFTPRFFVCVRVFFFFVKLEIAKKPSKLSECGCLRHLKVIVATLRIVSRIWDLQLTTISRQSYKNISRKKNQRIIWSISISKSLDKKWKNQFWKKKICWIFSKV